MDSFDEINRKTDYLLWQAKERERNSGVPNGTPEEPIWQRRTADWADWIKREIEAALIEHGDAIVEVVASEHAREIRRMEAEIKALKAEIGQLNAKITLLESIQKGGVAPLVKRSTDAA
jgi:hypothetical protein